MTARAVLSCIVAMLLVTFSDSFSTNPKEERKKVEECRLRKFGQITTFSREKADVEIPCRYRAAEFRCGDYSVKVTGESDEDLVKPNRFSLQETEVKIERTLAPSGVKQTWYGRVSIDSLDDFVDSSNFNILRSPWFEVRNTFPPGLIDERYSLTQRLALVRANGGMFEVAVDRFSLYVACRLNDNTTFASEPFPKTLCGGNSEDEIADRKKALGLDTRAQAVTYAVLETANKINSCPGDVVAAFNSCSSRKKVKAINVCNSILGERDVAKCVGEEDEANAEIRVFEKCLRHVCLPDGAAKRAACMDLLEDLDRCKSSFFAQSGELASLSCE